MLDRDRDVDPVSLVEMLILGICLIISEVMMIARVWKGRVMRIEAGR